MPALSPSKIGGLTPRKAKDESQFFSAILYGDPGIGKTTLGASISEVEEMSPLLILNIENGAQSIQEKYPEVDVLPIPNITALQAVLKDLRSTGGGGYKTLMVDNLTDGQQMGIEYFLSSDKNTIDFTEFESASFSNGAWSKSSESMRKLIRYFRALPMNVLFIAWKKNYSDNNVPDWRPAFTRTFGGEAPGMVNDVYHYYKAGDDRVLQTELSDRAVAKDRTGKLPKIIKNPDFLTIHKYWTGELVKPTAAEIAAAKGNGNPAKNKSNASKGAK